MPIALPKRVQAFHCGGRHLLGVKFTVGGQCFLQRRIFHPILVFQGENFPRQFGQVFFTHNDSPPNCANSFGDTQVSRQKRVLSSFVADCAGSPKRGHHRPHHPHQHPLSARLQADSDHVASSAGTRPAARSAHE